MIESPQVLSADAEVEYHGRDNLARPVVSSQNQPHELPIAYVSDGNCNLDWNLEKGVWGSANW